MGRATLLKGLCHKPPTSAPVRLALGRWSWLCFLPVSLLVYGFLRLGILAGIWGREGWQPAEGQGVASPTAHKES